MHSSGAFLRLLVLLLFLLYVLLLVLRWLVGALWEIGSFIALPGMNP